MKKIYILTSSEEVLGKGGTPAEKGDFFVVDVPTSTKDIKNEGENGVNKYISLVDLVEAGGKRAIAGGAVSVRQDYDFTIQAFTWVINNKSYSFPTTDFTLGPSDVTNDRVDLLVAAINELDEGYLKIKVGDEGLPAPTPTVNNEATELAITTIDVNNGTATPDEVTITTIYEDNGAESTTSGDGNFDYTTNPKSGTKSLLATDFNQGDQSNFVMPAPFNPMLEEVHSFWMLSPNRSWRNNGRIEISIQNGVDNPVSNWVQIKGKTTGGNSTYSFNSANVGVWQQIIIPKIAFGATSAVADRYVIRKNDGKSLNDDWQFDLFQSQRGISVPVLGQLQTALETSITPYKTLSSENVEDMVHELKDEVDLLGGGGTTSIENRYADITALLADQAGQTDKAIQQVTDASGDATVTSGYAYYEYLGTTVGDMTDYRKLSEEESMDIVAGGVASVVAGQNIEVDVTDPNNPIVSNTMTLTSEAHQSISTLPRQAMVSFVDDDGREEIFSVLKPELDTQGIKIGFGITTDFIGTPTYMTVAETRQLREEGHELLAHSQIHVNYDTMTEAVAEADAQTAATYMKEVLGEFRKGMVFPFNEGTSEISQRVIKKHYDYAFGGLHDFNIDQTIRTHQIKRIGYGLFVGLTPSPVKGVAFANTLEYYKACVDYAVDTRSWITFNLHCYETEFVVSVFNDLVDYIQGLSVPIVLPSVANATFGSSFSIGEDVDNEILVTKTGFYQNGINIKEVENPAFRILTPSVSAAYKPFFSMTYTETIEWTLIDALDGTVLDRKYTDTPNLVISDFDCSESVNNKYIYLRGSLGLSTLSLLRSNDSAILSFENFKAIEGLQHFYDNIGNTNIDNLDFRHNKLLNLLTISYSPEIMILPPETKVISGIENYVNVANYPHTTIISNLGKPFGIDLGPLHLLTSVTFDGTNLTNSKNMDITSNVLLTDISAFVNPIAATQFDVTKNINLVNLKVNDAAVTNWDLSQNVLLKIFWCDNGAFSTLDLSTNVVATQVRIRGGGVLTTVTLPSTATLTELRVDTNNIFTTLNNLSGCTGMKILHLNGSNLSAGSLDQIIIDLDNNGATSGDLDIGGQVGAVTRTSASDAAHASLLGKSWVIDVS